MFLKVITLNPGFSYNVKIVYESDHVLASEGGLGAEGVMQNLVF